MLLLIIKEEDRVCLVASKERAQLSTLLTVS